MKFFDSDHRNAQLVVLLSAMRAGKISIEEIAITPQTGYNHASTSDIIFLFNRAGEALIEMGSVGETALPIRRGSFAAFPRGDAFRLALLPGNLGADLVVGRIGLDQKRAGPLLSVLPSLLFMCPTRDLGIAWQDTTFQLIAECAQNGDAGSRAVVHRLLESLFAITVQRALSKMDDGLTPIQARDPAIGRALLLMQDQPGEAWDIAKLAKSVAMSKSSFSRTFRMLVGDSPMAHLAKLRMERAVQALSATDVPLANLAAQLGYNSESAFARAFKRINGQWPSAFRRGL